MLQPNAITIRPSIAPGQSTTTPLPVGTFQGRVITTASGLAVKVANVQLALPENVPLNAGQMVTVSRPTPDAAVVVTPHAPDHSGATGRNVSGTLGKLVSELGGIAGRNPELLPPLLPPTAPLTRTQMAQLISLFTARGALGPHLVAIAGHIQAALAAGWTPPEWVESFVQLARARPNAEPDAIVRWLKQAYASGTKTPEGALSAGSTAQPLDGLLAQVRTLQQDPALRTALEALHRLDAFTADTGGAADRLEARALQQLHALGAAYVFVELPSPFPDDASSVHLHWFRDGKNNHSSDQVVLDLSLSRLGDIWATVQARDSLCRCTLEATSDAVVQVLREEAAGLEAGLRGAGYASVAVRVQAWDGDRLRAAAHLMRRCTGLDIDA